MNGSQGPEAVRRGGRSWLGAVIVLAFVALCGYYVFAHREEFAFLRSISAPETAAAGLLILGSFAVNSYQLGLFLEKFGLRLSFVEVCSLTMGMLLGNLVLPMRGGTGGLAVYLKKVHGLDFQAFAAMYGGTAVLVALINTALALIALIVVALTHGFVHLPLSLFVAGLFAGCLYLSVFPPPVRPRSTGLMAPVLQAARSWHALTRDRSLLAKLTLSFLVISLALALSFFFIYSAMGLPLSAEGVVITSSLGSIANLVPLTPGSLGIFDAVVIQIPQLFGMDTARSVAGALVFRALCFLWSLVFGLPGLIYVMRLRARTSTVSFPEKN